MVSVHPNPPPGQGFTRLFIGGDPMEMKRAENNSNSLQTASFWNSGPGLEDPSKKVRKPYTITKSRESWSEQEHDMFLEALHLFDRDWKKIEAFIVTPDFAQVYSFIGSVFDPNASDHLQRLKMMDPVNVETVLMLMKNLSANLVSPEFESHRRLISSRSMVSQISA
ncbi:protein reveille 6 [Phtheirospermum japonicum]|uniref:Protein reveille 6 n=1 Tax=Phtheirospermum japonicum TaxID=374723 RepID=A0A830C021_9LAMI|nr:protein reveille 6 [Phtheirospermum japonicum]